MPYPVGRPRRRLDLEEGSETDVASRAALTGVEVDIEDRDGLAAKSHGQIDPRGARVAVVAAAVRKGLRKWPSAVEERNVRLSLNGDGLRARDGGVDGGNIGRRSSNQSCVTNRVSSPHHRS